MRNQFQWIVILTILYDEFTFSVKVFLAELSYEFENLMSAHFKNTPNLVQFASHISQNFIPHLLVTNPFSKTEYSNCKQLKYDESLSCKQA